MIFINPEASIILAIIANLAVSLTHTIKIIPIMRITNNAINKMSVQNNAKKYFPKPIATVTPPIILPAIINHPTI